MRRNSLLKTIVPSFTSIVPVSVLPLIVSVKLSGFIPRNLLREIYYHRKCCKPIF
jgi:hypothetical protein